MLYKLGLLIELSLSQIPRTHILRVSGHLLAMTCMGQDLINVPKS